MVNTYPLKKNNEFLRVYKKGSFYVGKYIVLYVLKNASAYNRIGITVAKKVGKSSVLRNRIRRLIRENYRLYENKIINGYDYVFVARSNDSLPTFIEIKKEMKFLLKKLKVFDQEK